MLYRGFFKAVLCTALSFLLFEAPSRATDATPEICLPRDDHAESATLDAYFRQNLTEHERYGFSRPLKAKAWAKASAFLEQRLIDKRVELCADRLKLVEDIKAASSSTSNSDCAGAVIVELLDGYMNKLASTFDGNRSALGALRDAHVNDLKLILFDIAKGSTNGLEGTFGGYALIGAPKKVKFEWIKQEASKMGGEAHTVWGGAAPEMNPLVQKNLVFAREAMRVRQERDAAKVNFHSDGKPAASCRAGSGGN